MSKLLTRVLVMAAGGVLGVGGEVIAQTNQEKAAAAASGTCRDAYEFGCRCGKSHALMQRAAMGLPIGEEGARGYSSREALADTDLLTVDLDIEMVHNNSTTAPAGTIAGTNTMRVRSNVNNLTQFSFNLRTQFNVTQVLLNGTTTATASAPASGSYARRVTLDRPYNAGEEFTVRIAYNGDAVSRGFGSITFGNQSGVPIISTLSEAYFAGTWWPVKDGDFGQPGDNGDKFTGTIAITVAEPLVVVSNGLLQSVTVPVTGKRKYRWTTNYPTSTYLYFMSATNYNQWSVPYTYPLAGGGTATMPVQFSIYPNSDTPTNRAAWERVLSMLPVLRTVYGEYPFVNEKYGIYQFPFGGGMEHQTYTGQGTFNESVTVHELGHQWWGDNVTCKKWNDIWLNEGFATYTEALWFERRPGSTGFQALRDAMNQRRPGSTADSVYVYDAGVANMNRIFSGDFSYDKAGWVLHQLRRVVGDATFFNILAAHRAAHQGRGATTDDFIGVVSSVVGRDMRYFFDQWVYGIGAPSYNYGWQNTTANGQNYLQLSIRQTQDPSWGSAGLFTMPIDVAITTGSGTQIVTVQNTALTQHYLIPVTSAVTAVDLDPNDWILIESETAEAYAAGPPKIVATSPAPNATSSSPPSRIDIVFSEPVNATAVAFGITAPGGASVPLTYSYVSASNTARLTPTATLAPGQYTVTALDTITSTTAGARLDGEVVGGVLPSGNGVPQGSASFSFTIPGCVADFDNGSGQGIPDGGVGIEDLLYYLSIYESGLIRADVDDGTGNGVRDGGVGIEDLLYYLVRYDQGC